MRIVMFSNTYVPHVGGVARSVAAFERCYRQLGHEVLIVAPEFEGQPEHEDWVVRVPAIQNFNGSDFSVALTTPSELSDRLDEFDPQLVHSHHPFLLGNEAVRVARLCEIPLVYTHHTLFEQYTHYVPADSSLLRRFVIELASRYANLSDQVIAPSESIAELLRERGVEAPVAVVPTGVDYPFFRESDGTRVREELGLSSETFVVGHVGRLAPEKNLGFLAEAVIEFVRDYEPSAFLLAGAGPSERDVIDRFEANGLQDRIFPLGEMDHDELRHVDAAMDVFAFASKSETQGMVLAEAMAAGTPVVALDASGVREILADEQNGRLIQNEDIGAFSEALSWVAELDSRAYRELRQGADRTAREYALDRSAERALSLYAELVRKGPAQRPDFDGWTNLIGRIAAEWEILSGSARALGAAAMDELVEGELARERQED